jgi:hypothetical protein
MPTDHNWPIMMPRGHISDEMKKLRARAQIGPVMAEITGQTA